MGQRLTPEVEEKTRRSNITVNIPREEYARLRVIADAEGAPIHRVITGLIDYYDKNEAKNDAP